MTSFKDLGLSENIIKGIDDLGFTEPSPIQEQSIPFIMKSGKDLIALAQTGTGKTAAFGLPILSHIKKNEKDLNTIILCPTRELSIQISQDLKKFAKHLRGVSITPVYGGERIDMQLRALKRGTNIVVGTPGRVHDLIRRRALKLQSIKWLVLDEADEMLDMGFKDDLDAILAQTPKTRQTFLFSATMSKSIHSIAKKYMNDTQEISVGGKNIGAENVAHEYYVANAKDRFDALKRILDCLPDVYGILFCRTKNETQVIADKLKRANYDTEAIHGDVSQGMRTKIMDRFKRKQVRLLVATDVAARGIDVSDLSHVINYNLPDQNETYTHRSGRTGRAKKSGVSISIVLPRETRKIKDIERIVGKTIEYKKIPGVDDIYKRQIDKFLDNVMNIDIESIDDEKYFMDTIEKLKKLKKDELIRRFIASEFIDVIKGSGDTRDLNANNKVFGGKGVGNDAVTLKIKLGKIHNFDIKKLFKLINSDKKLAGLEVGGIDLMSEYSIFSVEKDQADRVIKSLNGKKADGQRINIMISDEKVSSGRKRGRSGGGRRRRPSGGRGRGGDSRRGGFNGRRGKFSRGFKNKK